MRDVDKAIMVTIAMPACCADAFDGAERRTDLRLRVWFDRGP